MIAGAQTLWWLALPVLLLPIWWHRQKRQRVKSEPLATARFLPAAPPQTARIWRWEDLVLLALRCLLLAALIAWLAATAMPWRGDTVFVAPALATGTGRPAHAAWIEQQVAAAGLGAAPRMPLPENALQWLQAHEHEWRPAARILVLADSIPMPAQLPSLAHAADIRLLPAASATAATARAEYRIAVSAPPERMAAWRAAFAAFSAAGAGRYLIEDKPVAATKLIVWDSPAAPPAGWHAPLWWLPASAPFAAFGVKEPAGTPLTINGLSLQIADSPRGRLWRSSAMPPQTADTARALYETWQSLARPAQPYPMPAMQLAPRRSSPLAMPGTPPAAWLAYVLLALFALERLMTHVRRR
ncbi:hypothetical protein ASD15_30520 [Massilia sp. Root351]|jgi:hypothetical protein|uniref:BatA domain-containing protein n=1 Tax=Massilia sp. Root351 TaxID=1736522 RepID=UPI00070CC778|nr:BatA domain-containing protein [Massilia sp. Root351]KQV85367.1 hypothetical protein ASD15_30520 [Massilia sp. Root351]